MHIISFLSIKFSTIYYKRAHLILAIVAKKITNKHVYHLSASAKKLKTQF